MLTAIRSVEGCHVLTVRSLRRDRGLTLVDLALRTGIPARTLAQIECGIYALDPANRSRLPHILGVQSDILDSHLTPSREDSKTGRRTDLRAFVPLRLRVGKPHEYFRRAGSGQLSYLRRAGLALIVVLFGFALDAPIYPSPTAVGG